MKNRLIKVIIPILAIFGLCGLTVAPVFADDCSNPCTCDSTPESTKRSMGCPDSNPDPDKLPSTTINIINAVIAVLGIVAVVFVIVGGIQYMTSSGDPGKTKKAKDTILYATIGLIICVLSFAIVNFVIKNLLKIS